MQRAHRQLNLAWLALAALTLLSVALGRATDPGVLTALGVAAIMLLKGRIVIEQYLELGSANRSIRRWVYLFALLPPSLVVASHLFGPQLARLTQL